MTEVRVQLEGEDARLGVVPAADVARLILQFETAALRAASVVVRRPKTTVGRYEDVIRSAVRFRLVGVEEGSVTPVLELPEYEPPEGTLDLDVASLGESALDVLFAAADPDVKGHPLVATALLELADTLQIGDRYESVSFETGVDVTAVTRRARIDGDVRTRLRLYVTESMPPKTVREDAVIGVLVEADFENRTARLRTPTGPVDVVFDEPLDDDIHGALRQPSRLVGEVAYDRETQIARSVRLTFVGAGEQLVLGVDTDEFWTSRTFEDLARQQGAGKPVDLDTIFNQEATEEEKDAFMATLADLR